MWAWLRPCRVARKAAATVAKGRAAPRRRLVGAWTDSDGTTSPAPRPCSAVVALVVAWPHLRGRAAAACPPAAATPVQRRGPAASADGDGRRRRASEPRGRGAARRAARTRRARAPHPPAPRRPAPAPAPRCRAAAPHRRPQRGGSPPRGRRHPRRRRRRRSRPAATPARRASSAGRSARLDLAPAVGRRWPPPRPSCGCPRAGRRSSRPGRAA